MSEGSNQPGRRGDAEVSAPPAFALEVLPAPTDTLALRLAGEFDVATAAQLRAQLDHALARAVRAIVLDVAEVVFMDSSTLRELLRAHGALRQRGGVIVLAGGQPAVRRLLELTGTAELFVRAETRDEALAVAR